MGIDNVALDQILWLRQGGESLDTVMELGAQYVVGRDDPKKVKTFIEAFGGDSASYQALSEKGSDGLASAMTAEQKQKYVVI